MTTYQCILSTTVTKRLLFSSTVMSEPWKKVQKPDQDICCAGISPEPVYQHASECWMPFPKWPSAQTRSTVVQRPSGKLWCLWIQYCWSYHNIFDAKSIKQRVYHNSHHHRKEIEKQVKKMLQNCMIEPSVSPLASPVALVRKADKTLRLCIDYRNLNKATIKNSYLLPHIQHNLYTLYGNSLFTTLTS